MPKRLHKLLASLVLFFALIALYGWRTGKLDLPDGGFLATVSTTTMPSVSATATTNAAVLPAATSTVRTNATVVKVVDGDTLEAKLDEDGKAWKIRFLGINTPETVDPRRPVECFGKEASAKMHELADGKRIRLAADPQADERDKYGRLLRNVILEDGTDLNAWMVREGYAYAYLSFPLDPRRKAELKKLENDAKIAQRGLWNPQTCGGGK